MSENVSIIVYDFAEGATTRGVDLPVRRSEVPESERPHTLYELLVLLHRYGLGHLDLLDEDQVRWVGRGADVWPAQ